MAIVRVSGAQADQALRALIGRLPPPRQASLAKLRAPETGELLDTALVLRFVAPASATGEDSVELHLHGGRSVVAAVLAALKRLPNLREAEPGEFTRRAFQNGRIDLAEAEGLADLLTAETEAQRRAAVALAGGSLSRAVSKWQERVLAASAYVEAAIDFSDEDDVGEPIGVSGVLGELMTEISAALARPPAERLRDGVKVVIAGPPNAGKSSLLNYLVGREAAITSAIAGTTRDIVEAPTAIAGSPFLLIDTAGLRESDEEIERIGIERAHRSMEGADLIIWLGAPAECPDPNRAIVVQSKCDLPIARDCKADVRVSSSTGEGMRDLVDVLIARSRELLPQEGDVSINERHRKQLLQCLGELQEASQATDLLIASEALRQARVALDRITGRAGVEDMLDALFGRFCIGK